MLLKTLEFTKKNANLLENVSVLDEVDTAWTRNGVVIAKLITGRILKVNHDMKLDRLMPTADTSAENHNDSEYY